MSETVLKKFSRTFLLILAIGILLYFAYLIIDIFIILAISILLSLILEPFVHQLEEQGINRTFSTLIVFIAFGFIIYLALSVVIPKLIYQMDQLITSLRGFSFNEELKVLEAKILRVFPFFSKGEISNRIQNFISSQLANTVSHFYEYVSGLVSIVAVLVIVPFISFFLLKDSNKIKRELIHLAPNKFFEPAYWILKRVTLQLGRFVRGWIFDATFVGVVLGFGFWFIGIPNALPLGVIAGLGHLIPYFGPVIGGVPAMIISVIYIGDLSQIPLIILLVALTYTVDNGVVQPYVFSKSVDMHPIAIILLIIAGSQLFGLLGMLLAVPTATVIKTAAKEIYFAFKNYKLAKL
ncbi:AI-2E family transporter [Ignavibacterium sp.]|uniref:AI-2E family transporter n=1 Tax=Ignavibacterium sp. TaxID=2651167 RepID=UPI0021FE4E4F|nr:AI-2E family transporter [Ignavibacterium sp.]BDQ04139.1 MAG: AI-2E family transporter [Ignavibacterium sp.]